MNRLLCSLLLLSVAAWAQSAGYKAEFKPGSTWEFATVTTPEGVVWTNVRVQKVTADTLKVIHDGGAASLPLGLMPLNVQEAFHYDSKAAAEQRMEGIKNQVQKEKRTQELKKEREDQLEHQKRSNAARAKLQRDAIHARLVEVLERIGDTARVLVDPGMPQPTKRRTLSGDIIMQEVISPQHRFQCLLVGQNGPPGLTYTLYPLPAEQGMKRYTPNLDLAVSAVVPPLRPVEKKG